MSRGWYLCVALIEYRLLGLAVELEGRSRTFGPPITHVHLEVVKRMFPAGFRSAARMI
jgi:hypothetical protein